MRHLLGNLAVYVLATGLVIGSILFAVMREAKIVIVTEDRLEPREYATVEAPGDFEWQELGRRMYVANCQNCHGVDGTGYDVYPPVIGQIDVLTAEGGADYLTRIVVYGLATGEHPAPMPPMPNLSDAQVAAVNNYILTRFDDLQRMPAEARLYVPADVRRLRGERRSERDVGRMRPSVPLPTDLAGSDR